MAGRTTPRHGETGTATGGRRRLWCVIRNGQANRSCVYKLITLLIDLRTPDERSSVTSRVSDFLWLDVLKAHDGLGQVMLRLANQATMRGAKQEGTMKHFTSIEKIDTAILYALELTSSISVLLLAFGLIASM